MRSFSKSSYTGKEKQKIMKTDHKDNLARVKKDEIDC